MAGEWREWTLGELTDNFDSVRVPIKEADRRAGPYPYYGASGIVDHVDGFLFDGEYLLIGEDGENLRTRTTPLAFLARGKFWVNNHAHIVRANEHADARFLMYTLSATDISGFLTGSTMPKLTQGNLNRIPLLAPPVAEQRAIAHILGTLDDKIELNGRMSETLEAMGRTLFKSWFIDFDPVRAKAEGRDTGLPKHLADLFPSQLIDSELGSIPEGWLSGHFIDLAEHIREQENPLESASTVFQHYSIPAFDEGKWPWSELGAEIRSLKSRVPSGAILLSKLNPEIERVWLVDVRPTDRAVCSTEFVVVKPRRPQLRSYIYSLAQTSLFRRQLEGLVTGTSKSHQRVQVDSLMNLPLWLPPSDLIDEFSRVTTTSLQRVVAAARESQILAIARDALLPKLLSGQLRVEDAERVVARIA